MGGASNGQVMHRMRAEQDAEQAAQASALAEAIGRSVASYVGQLLADFTQKVTAQPDCFFCLSRAASAITGYRVAVANAQKASEPIPEPPERPGVNRSVTRMPCVQMVPGPAGPVPVCCDVPACFDCLMAAQSQAAAGGQRVSVGLVGVDGQPLVFRRD